MISPGVAAFGGLTDEDRLKRRTRSSFLKLAVRSMPGLELLLFIVIAPSDCSIIFAETQTAPSNDVACCNESFHAAPGDSHHAREQTSLREVRKHESTRRILSKVDNLCGDFYQPLNRQ